LSKGEGYQVNFTSPNSNASFTGILSAYEEEVIDEETGEMRDLRTWGGDETRSGSNLVMPICNSGSTRITLYSV
jgi:hypothetical protein